MCTGVVSGVKHAIDVSEQNAPTVDLDAHHCPGRELVSLYGPNEVSRHKINHIQDRVGNARWTLYQKSRLLVASDGREMLP